MVVFAQTSHATQLSRGFLSQLRLQKLQDRHFAGADFRLPRSRVQYQSFHRGCVALFVGQCCMGFKVKEETGKAIGNPDLRDRGTAEKIAAKVERKVGEVKKVFGK
jgi:hypothetical protein